MNTDLFVTLGDPKFDVKADMLIVFDISDILVERMIGYLISSLSLNEERWSWMIGLYIRSICCPFPLCKWAILKALDWYLVSYSICIFTSSKNWLK